MARRIATTVLGLAVLAGVWAFLWPASFGGQATWLVVEGAALEPYYSDGDLVLARAHANYDEGALVAASDGAAPVLGLVGEVEGDVLGQPWLHLSGAGDVLLGLADVLLSWQFLLAAGLVAATAQLLGRRRARATDRSLPAQARAQHALAS